MRMVWCAHCQWIEAPCEHRKEARRVRAPLIKKAVGAHYSHSYGRKFNSKRELLNYAASKGDTIRFD
jgi:hypothetical protein